MAKDRRPTHDDSDASGRPADGEPCAGVAETGATMDPLATPPDDDAEARPAKRTRAAPAPGLPISDAEYERLKGEARTRPLPRSKHGQKDPGQDE